VVGGGPAGLAGTVALIERGHHVTIIEQEDQLGGTPELVIRASRYPGAKAEIDAILQPALKAGRLDIRFGQKLGRDVTLENLRKQYDAVLLAGGVWQEASIGEPALPTAGLRQERARGSSPLQNRASSGGWSARDTAPSGMNGTAPQGVVDALTFLRQAKRGELKSVPRQVAVLGGGDSAMDAAAVAQELGAEDLYVVYPGPFSEMHWHMPDDWFRTSGAHCLTLTQPVGYQADSKGRLTGLTVCRNELGPADGSGRRQRVPVQGSQSVLKVGLVIEAMGLGVSDELKKALQGISWEDSGLVRTVSAGSFATGLDRVFVAGALINGGASAVQCISEGMKAAEEIDGVLGS
jgi:NADPH-dependent glutamate synthase beta subunit-like oxidoreductase